MRSRSSTTPHLPSYFLLITSIQLFHHQSYRHTFPVHNEPSKAKVHQIPNHPAKICIIELPHFFSLLQWLDGSPIEFLFCPVCCHAMAAYLVPYVAILSRPPIELIHYLAFQTPQPELLHCILYLTHTSLYHLHLFVRGLYYSPNKKQ